MEKDIYPRETIQMFPEQQVECHVDATLLMLVAIPSTPIEDGMIVMELCASSWAGVNKCLFASDRALTTHLRNNFSQIYLNQWVH